MSREPHDMRGGVLAILLVLVVLAALAVAAWFGMDYLRFRDAPLNITQPQQTFEIARGESFRDIVRDLRASRLSAAPVLYWRVLAEQLHVAGSLHAGEYALAPGMSARGLLQDMARGKVLQRRITLVEGWTFRQVRAALAAAPKLAQNGAQLSDAELMQKIGAGGMAPEGQFMPETYDYVMGMSDIEVLKRAYSTLQAYLDAQWPRRDLQIPLQTPYEALTLASIVEKETAQPGERPQIAGVFERRLKLGMKLETDPSVIYGMGADYDGKIHARDLQTDTPYNTYTRFGLPPTPIALAGRAAIDAVLHPAPGDTLYFVARGDGTHAFSSTLAEHNRNVAIYQLHRDAGALPQSAASSAQPASASSGAKPNTPSHKSHRHRR